MPRGWIKDINYQIHNDGRLWENGEHPKNPNPNEIHPLYRHFLSENLLMNLFRDLNNQNNKLTFRDYYNTSIHEILKIFASRTDTFFRDDFDFKEKRALRPYKVRDGRALLISASNRAKKDDAKHLVMKDLYLDTFYKNEARTALDEIIVALRAFQAKVEWICVPFLKLPGEIPTTGDIRPSCKDLEVHLDGGTYNGKQLMGFGDMDYHDMLFHRHKCQDEANAHHYARMFAFEKGFFDRETVVNRVMRENNERRILAGLPAIERHDAVITGGGNGYYCEMVPNPPGPDVRTCKVGIPQDYCVNNGSSFCPQ